MPLVLTVPDNIAIRLQTRSNSRQVPLDKMVLDMLLHVMEDEQDEEFTLEELVAEIKATPPNPKNIRPATGSLREALENRPDDPDFDLESWNRQWAAIEYEMKTITRLNDIAEGVD